MAIGRQPIGGGIVGIDGDSTLKQPQRFPIAFDRQGIVQRECSQEEIISTDVPGRLGAGTLVELRAITNSQ